MLSLYNIILLVYPKHYLTQYVYLCGGSKMVIISSASLYEMMNFRFLSSGRVESLKKNKKNMQNIAKIKVTYIGM